MEATPCYTFSLCIKQGEKLLLGTEIVTGDTAEEIAKAKKTIQRLLNEYTPAEKTLAPRPKEPEPEVASPPVQTVTTPSAEKPMGVRGLLHVRCPECDNIFGTFLREYQTDISCKCGHRIDLTVPLARFAYTCPYCEQTRYGRTNLEDAEITVRCKCGGDVILRWDTQAREYQN